MTKLEMSKLDKLYQEILLSKYDNKSIIDGDADLIHHFLQGKYLSIRWYKPVGVPLSAEQHNNIHAGTIKGKGYEEYIVQIKGKEWLKDINRQKNKIAKYLKYDDVVSYLLGTKNNYC